MVTKPILVSDTITEEKVKELAREWFDSIIKGAIDIRREIIALGGEYHIDAQDILIENGSNPEDTWGFNILLDSDKVLAERIEFISLINIRPAEGNRGMEIQDEEIKKKIRTIIEKRIS